SSVRYSFLSPMVSIIMLPSFDELTFVVLLQRLGEFQQVHAIEGVVAGSDDAVALAQTFEHFHELRVLAPQADVDAACRAAVLRDQVGPAACCLLEKAALAHHQHVAGLAEVEFHGERLAATDHTSELQSR